MVRPKQAGGTVPRNYRIPVDLLERVRAYQARTQPAMPPGMTFTETDAVVALLTLGLEAAEEKEK